LALVDAAQLCLLWDVAAIDIEKTSRAAQQPILKNASIFVDHLHTLLKTNSVALKEKAFLQLSDTLITFNRTYKEYKKVLSGIAYEASEELIKDIVDFFQSEMKNMDDTSTLSTQKEGEDIALDIVSIIEKENYVCNRKVDFIAALGKLIAYNTFGGRYKDHAPEILIHFVDHGKSVSDAIKNFLSLLRTNQPSDFDYIFATLRKKFESLNRDEIDYEPLVKLASRFSASYGITKTAESRSSHANLISQCVRYVSENVKDHAQFLSFAALPFLSKLDSLAAKTLINDYNEKMKSVNDEENEYLSSFKKALGLIAENKGNKKITKGIVPLEVTKLSPAKRQREEDAQEDKGEEKTKKSKKLKGNGKEQKQNQREDEKEEEENKDQEQEKEEQEDKEKEQEEKEEKEEQEDKEKEQEDKEDKSTSKKRVSKTAIIKAVPNNKKQKSTQRVSTTEPLKVDTSVTNDDENLQKKSDPSSTQSSEQSQEKLEEEEIVVPKRKRGNSRLLSQDSTEQSQETNATNEQSQETNVTTEAEEYESPKKETKRQSKKNNQRGRSLKKRQF